MSFLYTKVWIVGKFCFYTISNTLFPLINIWPTANLKKMTQDNVSRLMQEPMCANKTRKNIQGVFNQECESIHKI